MKVRKTMFVAVPVLALVIGAFCLVGCGKTVTKADYYRDTIVPYSQSIAQASTKAASMYNATTRSINTDAVDEAKQITDDATKKLQDTTDVPEECKDWHDAAISLNSYMSEYYTYVKDFGQLLEKSKKNPSDLSTITQMTQKLSEFTKKTQEYSSKLKDIQEKAQALNS